MYEKKVLCGYKRICGTNVSLMLIMPLWRWKMNGSKWNETETKYHEYGCHCYSRCYCLLPSTLLPLLLLLSPFVLAGYWSFLQQQQRNKQNSRKILIRFCMSCLFVFVSAAAAAVASVHLKHSWYESFVNIMWIWMWA